MLSSFMRPNRRAQVKRRSDNLLGGLITISEPASAGSEGYRNLRAGLLYGQVDTPPKVVAVSSPGPKEGKTEICANLGVVLAQADKSTLIIDCDLRKPEMHKAFGLDNIHGMVNILAGEYPLSQVWQEPLPELKVLTAGPLPPNPTELLSSSRFAELIHHVREAFDYVLVDTPPIGSVSDPLILANQVDGVLLVVDFQKTRKWSVSKSKRSLNAVRANLLGTVVNGVKDGNSTYRSAIYEGRGSR
jgi:capsular exopolysaccharide synthesis family protein